MADLILTGASRGIGAALARALTERGTEQLFLVARDAVRLEALARPSGGRAVVVPGDLSTLQGARELGARLAGLVAPGATLVHNAGLWPAKRALTEDGLETAFVVNHLAPLVMQRPLLDTGLVRRILVVSAGLLVKGRFDAARTPTGRDFSGVRTYCTTKLCLALAMRDVAAERPEVDVAVLHPGVVRTDLGARPGPVGWLLKWVKRSWESPEVCGERLARVLDRERWSAPGEARWYFEETAQPWPPNTEDAATRQAVRDTTARLLAHA
ncbi:SDR family NAD(P)-dependent oxidoreductase [Corallococcus sp. M34]|uniref:SDR family NAD(P)-dependent oxidoreductase n=1 Tax=Citreicoccus inhibens TaxID=2849499 RepID=UPI001C227790|nr:SDR family NAD(P)-dependent oxidoreductase [Citreicoccus inhibens]MBU8898409.1 SDR family NAD(P)-dependent oxidoreductase [Citreicoccus inhibens]